MQVPDLTPEEFTQLFDKEASLLDAEDWAILDRYAVPPFRCVHELEGVRGITTAPVWVVARERHVVLGYDEVEEEYGIGTLRSDGVVDDWGTFGARLRWSLIRFPDPAAYASRPST